MRYTLFVRAAFTAHFFFGCQTNKTINHHREGKWVYKDTVNGIFTNQKGAMLKVEKERHGNISKTEDWLKPSSIRILFVVSLLSTGKEK